MHCGFWYRPVPILVWGDWWEFLWGCRGGWFLMGLQGSLVSVCGAGLLRIQRRWMHPGLHRLSYLLGLRPCAFPRFVRLDRYWLWLLLVGVILCNRGLFLLGRDLGVWFPLRLRHLRLCWWGRSVLAHVFCVGTHGTRVRCGRRA